MDRVQKKTPLDPAGSLKEQWTCTLRLTIVTPLAANQRADECLIFRIAVPGSYGFACGGLRAPIIDNGLPEASLQAGPANRRRNRYLTFRPLRLAAERRQ